MAHGDITHIDIPVSDPARASEFYSGLFGWAINEEYVYDRQGRVDNASFLDYRIPVASDLPMIDTVIIEVPSAKHPHGVRGVGEVPIVPPLAAVANAINNALGIRFHELPVSPPKVLKAITAKG